MIHATRGFSVRRRRSSAVPAEDTTTKNTGNTNNNNEAATTTKTASSNRSTSNTNTNKKSVETNSSKKNNNNTTKATTTPKTPATVVSNSKTTPSSTPNKADSMGRSNNNNNIIMKPTQLDVVLENETNHHTTTNIKDTMNHPNNKNGMSPTTLPPPPPPKNPTKPDSTTMPPSSTANLSIKSSATSSSSASGGDETLASKSIPRWITVNDETKHDVQALYESGFRIIWSGICCNDTLVAEALVPPPTTLPIMTPSSSGGGGTTSAISCSTPGTPVHNSFNRILTTTPPTNACTGTLCSASATYKSFVSPTTLEKVRKRLLLDNRNDENKCNGWNYKTYYIKKCNSRAIHALKFHIYDRIPYNSKSIVVIYGIQNEKRSVLNGQYATVIEYLELRDMYLVQMNNTSASMRIIEARNLYPVVPDSTTTTNENNKQNGHNNNHVRVWTFAALYIVPHLPNTVTGMLDVPNNSNIPVLANAKSIVCSFLDKIISITHRGRLMKVWNYYTNNQPTSNDCNNNGKEQSKSKGIGGLPIINVHEELCCQDQYGPVLETQIHLHNNDTSNPNGTIMNGDYGGGHHNHYYNSITNSESSCWYQILQAISESNNNNNNNNDVTTTNRFEDDRTLVLSSSQGSSTLECTLYYMEQNKQYIQLLQQWPTELALLNLSLHSQKQQQQHEQQRGRTSTTVSEGQESHSTIRDERMVPPLINKEISITKKNGSNNRGTKNTISNNNNHNNNSTTIKTGIDKSSSQQYDVSTTDETTQSTTVSMCFGERYPEIK